MLLTSAAGLLLASNAQNAPTGPHDLLMAAFNQLRSSHASVQANPRSMKYAGGELLPGLALFGGMVKPGEKITFTFVQPAVGQTTGQPMLYIASARGRKNWPAEILASNIEGGGAWTTARMGGMTSFQIPLVQSYSFTITLDGPSTANALPDFVLVAMFLPGPFKPAPFANFVQQFNTLASPLRNLQNDGYNWKSGQISFVAHWKEPNGRFLQVLPLMGDNNVVVVSNGAPGKTNWSNNVLGEPNALEITGDSGFQISKTIGKSPDHFISARNLSDNQQLISVSALTK